MNAKTFNVRLGRTRKTRLLIACVFGLVLGTASVSVSFQPQAAKGATLSFALKYQESGSFYTKLELGTQEVKFRKEPVFASNDKIVRQALKVGPNQADFLGFAVNLTRKMLYLDLNQNLDLTDDPNGVYRSQNIRGSVSYFRGIRITLHTGGAERSYLLEPFYYFENSPGNITIRSIYGGEVELHGRKWQLQVQDNLDGRLDAQDKFLIIPVVAKGDSKSSPYRPMPVPKSLFFDGRQYQLSFVFGANPRTLMVSFVETDVPLANLEVEGQWIRGLILRGTDRLALMGKPDGTVRLPVDDYRIYSVQLQSGPGKPGLTCVAEGMAFPIKSGVPNHLNVGAPFTGSAVAQRSGSVLRLRFLLRGASGEEYSFTNPDKRYPPKFAIYKGDKLVASGNFQYG